MATRPSLTLRSIGFWRDRTALNSSATRVASAPRHQRRATPRVQNEPRPSGHQLPDALLYDEREGGELRGFDLATASAASRPSITLRRVRKLRTECSKTSEYAMQSSANWIEITALNSRVPLLGNEELRRHMRQYASSLVKPTSMPSNSSNPHMGRIRWRMRDRDSPLKNP